MQDDIALKEKTKADKSDKETEATTPKTESTETTKKDSAVVIEFRDVIKSYPGPVNALDGVSFDISIGEFISLVGPSGAGKSTIIKLITCEEKPTSGKVLIAGRDVAGLKAKELPYFRRKVGVIFQDFKLLPKKTVFENIAFALEVSDATNEEIKQRVPQIIELVGLSNRAFAFTEALSGGEKQRVSIARALVHNPKLLIADEPTGNLDPVSTWEIIELLFKINKQGTIVLLATHDKEVVDALERRVITLKNGKIASDQKKGKYQL
jgi:cell division transport system ATP-binding protein